MTFQTARRQPFFRKEAWTALMIEVLHHYFVEYELHHFVIMEDHIHILLTPTTPVERAIQLIKGGYSFRAKRAFEGKFDIWQTSFSDHRIRDDEDFEQHVRYIEKNAAERGDPGFPFTSIGSGTTLRG